MNETSKELCYLCCGMYACVVAIMVIAISSWMINISNSNRWRQWYNNILEGDAAVIGEAYRSWYSSPVVEIELKDIDQYGWSAGCSQGFEELAYDIWPGTRGHCDCLQRAGQRDWSMDKGCSRGKQGTQKSPDCHDRHGLAPIVQNRIKNALICGKRSTKSFNEMVRPEKVDGKWQCPENYKACEDHFDKDDGHNYIICYEKGSKFKEECPITDFAFEIEESEQGLYEKRDGAGLIPSYYVSRKKMRHGIERMTMSPMQPCLDQLRYNARPNQQFWFAEMRQINRNCPIVNEAYEEV